jgi:hypothetical protein
MEMDGEPGGKHSQVKIQACKGSKAERDSEQIQSVHVKNIDSQEGSASL